MKKTTTCCLIWPLTSKNGTISQRNGPSSEPTKLKELQQTLAAWQKETGASIPTKANPAYKPGATQQRGGAGGGGAGRDRGREGQMQRGGGGAGGGRQRGGGGGGSY
ncbi:MAG: hypothetical protein ACKO0N_08655 [Planctomycetota bacterium]